MLTSSSFRIGIYHNFLKTSRLKVEWICIDLFDYRSVNFDKILWIMILKRTDDYSILEQNNRLLI